MDNNLQHFIKKELASINFDGLVNLIFRFIGDTHNGNFIFVGVGKTAYVASRLNASYLSMNIGSRYLHAADALHGDMGCVTCDDVSILFSYSGETSEILNLAQHLKERSCRILAVTHCAGSSLEKIADETIFLNCSNGLPTLDKVPSISLYAMEILFDLFLAYYCQNTLRGISDFADNHPEGGIGGWFSTEVAFVMRNLDEITIAFHKEISIISSRMDNMKTGIALLIDDENKIIGCLSSGDIRRHQSNNKKLISYRDINENPLKISKNQTIKQALKLMKLRNVNVVFVTGDDNEICGYVKISDLVT